MTCMTLHESGVSPNSELPNIRRDELQLKYEEISSQASQLEAKLTALEHKHAKLVKAAAFYQAAMAPWKKIPNEILQRIFYWTKPTEIPTCVPFSRTVAPMQLAQVCWRWRAVAIATPAIWQEFKCSIYLPPDRYDKEGTKAFIQSWVSRAGTLPLTIIAVPPEGADLAPAPGSIVPSFSQVNYYPALQSFLPHLDYPLVVGHGMGSWLPMPGKLNFIKDIIIPNTARIRELHLTLPRNYSNAPALMQQDIQFPLLEVVTLDLPLAGSVSQLLVIPLHGPTPPPLYILLESAPRLRKVKLGVLNHFSHVQMRLNWSGITHFEAAMVPSSNIMNILSQLTSLQHCKVSVIWIRHAPAYMINPPSGLDLRGPSPNVSIPTLHTLDLAVNGTNLNINPVFNPDNMHLPNLKVFSIPSEAWYLLTPAFLANTTSLTDFHVSLRGQSPRDSIKTVLSLPVFSQLTHFSYRSSMQGATADTIEPGTLKAIALGQLVPNLHTFGLEGKIPLKALVNLLATKGFVLPHDGSTVYPNVGKAKRRNTSTSTATPHPTQAVAVPFRQVRVYGCGPDIMGDSDLKAIQNLVGVDCFKMDPPEVNHWMLMQMMSNQIGWDADD